MKNTDPSVAAIVAFIRSELPPINEVMNYIPTTESDMGPTVSLPAVYLHILTSHWNAVRLEAEIAEMQPKVRAYEAWSRAMLTGQMAGEA